MAPSARSRRLRWAAPFAVAAVIVLIVAIPGLSSASTPNLAAVTPAQLIAKVERTNVAHLSGTIDLTTNLGIPDLSALSNAASSGAGGGHDGQAFDPTSLLSGTHQALVFINGRQQNRVDLLESMAEYDVIHSGTNVWTWDSTTKQVTHRVATPKAGTGAGTKAATGAGADTGSVRTPQQVADNLLAQVTPSTAVSVGKPVTVAHRSAYQLVLAPRSAQSTLDHIAIAVDSATGLPLQVQIFAKGQKLAAVKLGYGQISFSAPSASEFNFTAPAGSTVTNGSAAPAVTGKRHLLPGNRRLSHQATPATAGTPGTISSTGQQTTVGQGWTTVAILHGVQIPAQFQEYLKAGTPVSGAFGKGTLIQTAAVNILVLNDGRVAVGAVNPSALEAAVAAGH